LRAQAMSSSGVWRHFPFFCMTQIRSDPASPKRTPFTKNFPHVKFASASFPICHLSAAVSTHSGGTIAP
jgi:hypothetical protein